MRHRLFGRHRSSPARRATPLVAATVVGAVLAVQLWWNRIDTPVLTLSADGLVQSARSGSTLAHPAEGDPSPAGDTDPRLRLATAQASATLSATTLAQTSTAPAIQLPVPALLPEDAYADTPEVVVGRITIPALGIDEALQQGMTLTAINRGPSHWPGTAGPGQLGNMVVAGHRTTFSRPFRYLDKLQPGDQVIYTTEAGSFAYAVTSTEIVSPEAVEIADQTVGYTSTLFACHPPGSAAQRIVTRLQLLDGAGQPVVAPTLALTPVTVPRG